MTARKSNGPSKNKISTWYKLDFYFSYLLSSYSVVRMASTNFCQISTNQKDILLVI